MNEKATQVTVEALLSEQDWLRALARTLVRDEARADDLLQDVWLKVVSGPPRTVRSIRAWLTRVLVNRHRDVERSEGARSDREDSANPRRAAPSAADLVARVDAQQRVAAAVLALDEPLRETVLLRYFEELPVREVARRMGVPYETARARLARGLMQLRARLAPDDGRGGRSWSAGFLALAGIGPTGDAAAAAALTGVVIAMKQKLTIVVAAVVLLAAGIGGWQLVSRGSDEPAPEPAPEEFAVLPPAVPEEDEAPDVPPVPAAANPGPDAPPEEKLDPKKGACHGTVTHPDGTPAVGVSVRLSGRPAKVVKTDAEGRFRIANEWVDQMGRSLYVGPKTGLIALGNVPLRAGEDVRFDVTLPAGTPVAVEVVSAADGQPLPGVWICMVPLSEPVFPTALCITDRRGKGALSGLPPREYRVYVASQGFRPLYRERLDLTTDRTARVLRIRLEDPEELRLRVVPPPEKKAYVNLSLIPIPEDPVKGQYFNGGDLSADGVFVGVAPPPGKYWAHVDVYGVARWTIPEVIVREREPLELTVHRKTGGEVRGTLLGPDDKPIRGRVTLTPRLPDPDGADRKATTNEKGEFRIPGVPPCSASVNVQVGRQTFNSVIEELIVPETGLPDLVIRLPEGGSLSGRIQDSPLPTSHIANLYRKGEDGWRMVSWVYPDPRGHFLARHLPAGRYVVMVRSFRAELGWARPVVVSVREGEKADPVDVAWLPCPAVEMTVSASDGTPVTGKLMVQAMPQDDGADLPPGGLHRYFEATLDENGRCTLESLAPGRLHIQVNADGKSAARTVEILESRNPPLRFRLPE